MHQKPTREQYVAHKSLTFGCQFHFYSVEMFAAGEKICEWNSI